MTLDPSLGGNNPNSSASFADLMKSFGSLNSQSSSPFDTRARLGTSSYDNVIAPTNPISPQAAMTGGFGQQGGLGGLTSLSSLLKGAPYPTASEVANSGAVNPNKGFGSFSSSIPGYSDFGKGMGGVGGGGGSSMNLGNLSVNFNPSGGGGMSFAKGGEVPSSGGIKTVAQELQDYGRGGDTMLAHINPQEAMMLKAMGGSGTINPVTGLPEYFVKRAFKAVTKPVENIAKGIEKAVIRPIGDVVKPILPYVQYVAPFIPGVGPLAAAGLGALGSGFAQGGGFNFKRGLMGGMTAYGLSNLYAGVQAAGGAAPPTSSGPMELGVTGTELAPTTVAQTGLTVPPGAAGADIGSQVMAGNFSDAASTVGQNISQGVSNLGDKLSTMGTDFSNQMGNAGQGLKNLTGFGETTMTSGDAVKAFGKQFGSGSAMGIYGGVTGAQALDEMDDAKLQVELANAKSKEEYDAIMSRIEASRQRGIAAMRANPYQFAMGGSVDDEAGFDDFNDAPGIVSMNKGGMSPRFLSGGGDGMSDDIKATINGKQPARLADGEFVIPADVVSHLGNGSSKAGAKRLYNMMDKVRVARTGNKKQGKEINPNKFLLA